MKFQLKKLLLWPNKVDAAPREVLFRTGCLNVISGNSRTGKSAVIPIVDYCLGAGKCAIPVNTIRDSCAWFGVLVELATHEVLVARRSPEGTRGSNDFYLIEGVNLATPYTLEKNANLTGVREFFDSQSGLTRLQFDEVSSSGFRERPSFRDMAAFTFQPQNIVANPDVLFFKADTYEHREKLKTIFPYVLGVITPDLMAKQFELGELEKSIRKREHELSQIERVSTRWVAEVSAQLTQARELNLVSESAYMDDRLETKVALLRDVVEETDAQFQITSLTITETAQAIASLQTEEAKASTKVMTLKRRLSEMAALRAAATGFSDGLSVQRDRLLFSKWLNEKLHNSAPSECPVCASLHTSTQSEAVLSSLTCALERIEEEAKVLRVAPASIDREEQSAKVELEEWLEKLRAIQHQLRELERRNKASESSQYSLTSIARFLGNLDRSISFYDSLGNDRELERELNGLKERRQELLRFINPARLRAHQERMLHTIGAAAARIIPNLDVEYPDAAVHLSLQDLNVKINHAGNESYLWELGSGSNWLGYHIAITLALQWVFSQRANSPVPSFIIYDQPSQVYFPRQILRDEDDPNWRQPDIDAVKRTFKEIARVVSQLNGSVQVIVLDHAAADIWGDLDLHLVEEWRNGAKLVPDSWIAP